MVDDSRPEVPARELEEILELLRELVLQAKSVPLSSSVFLPREEALELIEEALQSLPGEVQRARWMLKERDSYLERVQLEADEILEAARARAERMIAKTEVVRGAQTNANRIVVEAKERASRIRLQSEDFLDQRLASFEIVLTETLEQVRRGRRRLGEQAPPPAAPAVSEPDDHESSTFFDQDEGEQG
ncbi:MAG: ATP synthase subunit B family protein [Ferrimicrobium sp.]